MQNLHPDGNTHLMPVSTPIKPLLNLKQVSAILNYSIPALRQMCKDGKIEYIRIMRKYLFEEDAITQFVARSKAEGKEE